MEENTTSVTLEEECLECSTCHTLKPKSEFYKVSNYWHQKRGYSYSCKECSRKSARASLDRKKEGSE